MYYAVVCDCGGWDHRHEFTDIDRAIEYAQQHIGKCYLKHREIVIYEVEAILRY